MGKICSKDKNDGVSDKKRHGDHKKTVIFNAPDKDQTYTRGKDWVGLKNLHNTCFINSGRNA